MKDRESRSSGAFGAAADLQPLHHSRDQAALAVGLAAAVAAAAMGVLISSASLEILLDRFLPDDVFYYYQPARVFAQRGFSSFDGLHFTNGYQPLWFLMCVPVFWLFPDGGEAPIRILQLVQVAFVGAGLFVLMRTLAERFSPLAIAVAFTPWMLSFQPSSVCGLEVAISIFFQSLLMRHFLVHCAEPAAAAPGAPRFTVRAAALLGLLTAVAFLARTDVVFLGAALFLWVAWHGRAWTPAGFGLLVAFVLPIAILDGGYVASNLWLTGHAMPVSGAAKVFYSELSRNAAAARLGGLWPALVENWLWPFRDAGHRPLAFGLIAPWIILLASLLPPLRETLAPFRRLWPFVAGAVGAWFYYATAFRGGFSSTGWYYHPLFVVSMISVAAISGAFERLTILRGAPGFVALLIVGALVNYLRADLVWIIMIGAILVGFLFARPTPRLPEPLVGAAVLTALGLWAVLPAARGIEPRTWLASGALSCLAAAIGSRGKFPHHGLIAGSIALVGGATVMRFAAIRDTINEQPRGWNYHLYRGAQWARANLPLDATIWSGSTGILGYFSDRTCVNTDGLANSYEFVETVLKAGKLNEYQKKWDYAVDAHPDDELARIFPGGAFVPLPDDLILPEFDDPPLRRRLRIYKMRAPGGDVAVPPAEFELVSATPLGSNGEIEIRFQSRHVRPNTVISLGYDADETDRNGNEKWIIVDGLRAAPGVMSYRWRPKNVPPGTYHLIGYLHDGKGNFANGRLNAPITVR